MYLFRSRLLHCSFLFLLAALLVFGISKRSSSLIFAAASTPVPNSYGIYLYRRSALAAYAQPFRVLVDGQLAGFLANASYVRLPLKPGSHQLQVVPGGLAQVTTLQVDAQTGSRAFYEFVFPTGWAMRPSFQGAAIEVREESQAVEALQGLYRTTDFAAIPTPVNTLLTAD
jgi:hypothetical protein